MRLHHRRPGTFVHTLFAGVLALLIALLFVSPERLLDPTVPLLAPAPAQAQTTTDCAAQTDVPQAECEALLALYTATDGQSWTRNDGWGQNDNYAVCSWEGITCTNGSVTELYLYNNELSGSIPPELGNLTNLQVLGLPLNQLSGSIPPELGRLTNVTFFALFSNQLTGSIPPALGNLTNVQYLSLAGNQLRGNIPPELGNLTNLSVLDLSSDPWTGGISQNQLSGNIPPQLANLTKLEELNLANNQLTGSVPPELGTLTNLTSLNLAGNQITGSILPELTTFTKLEELNLAGNQLTGNIPPQLANLTKLEELNLANNQITGNIPPALGNLTNLRGLNLSNNQLGGTIPPELGNLTKLISLELSDNQLSGNISAGLGNLTNLQVLRLSFNELSGSIPPQLGNLTQVAYLYLSNNQLDTNVTDATLLAWLNQNRLNTDNWRKQRAPGTPAPTNCAAQTDVPQAECEALLAFYTATDGANWHNNDGWKRHYAVCDWGGVTCTDGRVTSLNLAGNQITGSILPELGTLTSLTSLYLNDNQLRGSIPSELGSLTNLQVLWLSENQLSGSIPSELGSLTNLTSLNLSNNQLSGSIPPELGSFANLQSLNLAENELSGSIPPQLANLKNVSQLYLANNYLATNVTDAALLAWLNERDSDWRNQRVPSVQLSTVITGTVGGELVVPRDRRVGVRLTVPAGALPTEPVTMTYTGLPLLDTPLPNNQMMSGRFVLTATSTLSGSLAQTTRLLTLTVDLAPAAPQLAQTTPLSPVIYARNGAAWVPAETLCSTAGCQQQASDTQVTLLLDYVGEFAVGITPRRVYLPLVVRAQQ